MMRKVFPLLVVIHLLWCATHLAAEVQIFVRVGFQGRYQVGQVIPVYVTLMNTGQHTQATVQLTQCPNMYAAPWCYIQHVLLPAPSRKMLVFYPLLNNWDPLWVTVKTSHQNEIIEKVPLDPKQATHFPLWLNVYSPGNFPTTKTVIIHRGKKDYKISVNITPAELPTHAAALQYVQSIMILAPLAVQLRKEQYQALWTWMAAGGTLLLPYTLRLRHKVPPWLQPWRWLLPQQLPAQGFVVSSCDRGRVIWWDPQKERQQWLTLVNQARPYHVPLTAAGHKIFQRYYNSFGSKNISLLWVVWLMGIYILCIGPLDYYFVKLMGKDILTWPILVSAIIVFSSLAYLKSSWLKSGPLQVISSNCCDIMPTTGQSICYSFSAIYSTRNTHYTIRGRHAGTLWHPLASNKSNSWTPSLFCQQDNDWQVQVRIPIYSTKSYESVWFGPTPWRIRGGPLMQGGWQKPPQLKLELPAGVKLAKGYVITKKKYYRLDARQGQHWQLTRINYSDFVKLRVFPLYNAFVRFQSSYAIEFLKFLSCARHLLKHSRYRQQLYDFDDPRLDLSKWLDQGKAIVLLCIEQAHLRPVQLVGETPRYHEINLVRLVVPLQ